MTDTQPFMDEVARNITRGLWLDTCSKATLAGVIATALSSAYQRGREEERERCTEIADKREQASLIALDRIGTQYWEGSASSASDIATAIRTERDKG